MDKLNNVSAYAELAQAAYATLPRGAPAIAGLIDAGMSDAQARRFASTYSVVDSYHDLSGVSATVLEDLAGDRYLAIRGTEVTSLPDLNADYILANGWPPELNPQFTSIRDQIDRWSANGTLPAHFSVTGHSLGGFLAAGVALNCGARVDSTYTFNAPGIGGIGPNLLPSLRTLFGLPASSALGKYFNVRDGSGISVVASLGVQLTPPILIETEAQLAPWDNHKIGFLADALAVYRLAGQLDPIATTETAGSILRNAGAAETGEQEDAINALNRTLGVNTRVRRNDREGFWKAAIALESDESIKTLFGKVTISTIGVSAAPGLGTSAKTDFGDLVTLKTLSPFALHPKDVAGAEGALNAVWQSAHGADFVDWTSDKVNRGNRGSADKLMFTNEWYRDRAGLLRAVLTANELDASGQRVTVAGAQANVKAEYHYYTDGNPIRGSVTG